MFTASNRLSQYSAALRGGAGNKTNAMRRPSHRDQPERPRVGLVLGGGGAKAAAHIGVLRVLQQAGIEVDIVGGSSAGALVSLFHCAGYTPEEMVHAMRQEFCGGRFWQWIPGGGYWRLARLLRRGGLRELIARRVAQRQLEELPTHLCVTASDLITGEAVVFDRGSIERAVMASMSLPGLAPPIVDGKRLLVDGSILNDLPVEALRDRGAEFIIAVDLSAAHVQASAHLEGKRMPASRILWRAWQLQQQRLAMQLAKTVDVLIQPDLSASNMADFSNMERLVEIGAAAADSALPSILGALRSADNEETGPPTRKLTPVAKRVRQSAASLPFGQGRSVTKTDSLVA